MVYPKSRLPIAPFVFLFITLAFGAYADWIGPLDIDAISNHGLNPVVTPVQAVDGHPVGDRHNSYPWSMAWFGGKLYVGTNRDFFCLMAAFLEAAGEGAEYPPTLPDLECTEDVLDLDLYAEIWEYTPQTQVWRLIYKSPAISVEQDDGSIATTARDAGYRSMTILTDDDGIEWLYILGYSSQTLDDVPPPRLLRANVTTLAQSDMDARIEDVAAPRLADPSITTARGLEVFRGHLFLSYNYDEGTSDTGERLVGAGVLMYDQVAGDFVEASTRPLGGNFYNVGAFELAVYNDQLWVGTFNPLTGFEVLRTNAVGPPPWDFIQIVTDGAYRPIDEERNVLNESVVSMAPFRGSLYVGSGILFGGNDVVFENGPAPAEVIRINSDDSWDLVAAQPRRTPDGLKLPISGMGPGFGNVSTGYIWRMIVHNDWLYVGTMDNSYILQYGDPSDLPEDMPVEMLEMFVQVEAGFDLWKTYDGRHWFQLTRNGFGDELAVGVRSMATSEHGLFIGGADPYYGCRVWLGDPGTDGRPLPVMDLEAALAKNTVALLSWTPVAGVDHYRILRAEPLLTPQGIPLTYLDYVQIDTVSTVGYADRSISFGEQYRYSIVGVDSAGKVSDASNVVTVGITIPDVALPVILSSFTGELTQGQVLLKWETASEWQNLGFNIYRGTQPDGPFAKLNQEVVPSQGSSGAGAEYHWVDDSITGTTSGYYYYIEDVGLDGNGRPSDVIRVTDGVGLVAMVPKDTLLLQNYPNAFNPETWIPYQLENASRVQIDIYDSRGYLVRSLELGEKPAGYYLDRSQAAYWDGRNQLGEHVTSGVYYYRFQAGDYAAIKKMVVVQ